MRLPVPCTLRGGSEPPRDTNSHGYQKRTSFRVGGVLNGSTDNISTEETKNGGVRGIMPFGSSENNPYIRQGKGTRTTQKRRTSVGNIVAALEAEIRSRKERECSLEPRCSRQTSEDRPLPSYIYGITGGSITQGLNNTDCIPIHSPSLSSSSSLESNTSPINPRQEEVQSQPWMGKGSIYSTLSQYNQDEEVGENHVVSKEFHSSQINGFSYVCSTSREVHDYKEESVIEQNTSNHINSNGFQIKSMNQEMNDYAVSSDSETSIKSYLEKENICNREELEAENRDEIILNGHNNLKDSKNEELKMKSSTSNEASSLFSQNLNSFWNKSRIKTFSNVNFSTSKEKEETKQNRLNYSTRDVLSTPDGLPRLTPVGRRNNSPQETEIENEISVEKTITISLNNDVHKSKRIHSPNIDTQSETRIKVQCEKQSLNEMSSNSSTHLVDYTTRFEEKWEEHTEEKVSTSHEQNSIFLTECNTEDKNKSTYTVNKEERKNMEDLFEELVAKTKVKRDETESTLFTEDTFFNDLVQTDTGTITGLEDHESDVSSSTDDIHSMMSPTNKKPDDNSYEVDTSDDKAIIFKYHHFPPRHRRKSVSDLDAGTKLRNKRKRNRTVDIDSWQGTVCQYTQRTYLQEEKATKVEEKAKNTESYSSKVKNVEQDLEQGLEIIIDRLRNIETKLDELKTMETSHSLVNPTTAKKNENIHIEEVVSDKKSPGLNDQSDITNEEDSSMLHYAINCQNEEPPEENQSVENETQCEEDEEDDDTLKEEYIDDNASILTEKTEIICMDEDITGDELDFSDYRISSPASVNCSVGKHRSRNLEIISLSSVDDDCTGAMFTETEEETEDEEDISRKRRIEQLAKQLLEETLVQHNDDYRAERPSYINLDLDTVSERSEDDTDFDWKKSQESKKKNFPTRRARSESRERTLHRIKYCWRCHNTGHESFDCRIEPQPGSWCPRCLEVSHWEDQCWVNDTEVFCNVCSLPGHLPCVHQTNDFRQRKLVIETFGWLSFKEWFREAEFWSWWNVSGFTNVPLYKLMQHRPGEVAPN